MIVMIYTRRPTESAAREARHNTRRPTESVAREARHNMDAVDVA